MNSAKSKSGSAKKNSWQNNKAESRRKSKEKDHNEEPNYVAAAKVCDASEVAHADNGLNLRKITKLEAKNGNNSSVKSNLLENSVCSNEWKLKENEYTSDEIKVDENFPEEINCKTEKNKFKRPRRKTKAELSREKEIKIENFFKVKNDKEHGLEMFLDETKGCCIRTVKDRKTNDMIIEYHGEIITSTSC